MTKVCTWEAAFSFSIKDLSEEGIAKAIEKYGSVQQVEIILKESEENFFSRIKKIEDSFMRHLNSDLPKDGN